SSPNVVAGTGEWRILWVLAADRSKSLTMAEGRGFGYKESIRLGGDWTRGLRTWLSSYAAPRLQTQRMRKIAFITPAESGGRKLPVYPERLPEGFRVLRISAARLPGFL